MQAEWEPLTVLVSGSREDVLRPSAKCITPELESSPVPRPHPQLAILCSRYPVFETQSPKAPVTSSHRRTHPVILPTLAIRVGDDDIDVESLEEPGCLAPDVAVALESQRGIRALPGATAAAIPSGEHEYAECLEETSVLKFAQRGER
jgi:hypothetical protein